MCTPPDLSAKWVTHRAGAHAYDRAWFLLFDAVLPHGTLEVRLRNHLSHHDSDTASQAHGPDPIVVLLVDDQRFIGMAVTRLLATERDIEVHCCYAATEAIARANELTPAIIFQDLQMPDVDGRTLVGLYRCNPATATTAIIVLSGNDDASSRTGAIAAGADDYLVKLPDKATLVDCIRRHAAGPAVVSTAVASAPAATADEPGEPLDRQLIERLCGAAGPEGAAVVAKFIAQFLDEAAVLVRRLTDAASRADARELQIAAHSLKGTSLMMGATRLGALGGEVEDHAGRHPSVAVDPALVAAIAEECLRVRAWYLEASHSRVDCPRA